MPGARRTDRPALAGAVTGDALERGTACLRERGQPTGGSAAPGGLPPVGRGRLPPRGGRVPLLPRPALAILPSHQLANPLGDFRVLACDLAGPGPAWRAEGVPLKP